MVKKYKINDNNLNKGGAETSYNPSYPVDAHFSTGFLDKPSKIESKNTHDCPYVVNVRNGGENDMKTKIRASKVLTSPNLEGQSEHPLKTELENIHVYPSVSYRNGGENDMKTRIRARKVLTSPNLKSQETELLNKCNSWSKYVSTFETKYEVNTGPGIYIFTEVDELYGIIMKSSIAYVGKTTRSLGSRAKEHFRDCVDPNFHHWLSKAEKNKKLKILFKRFPEKYLSNIEQFFIYKLNPIFNKIHNNGGKKYVR